MSDCVCCFVWHFYSFRKGTISALLASVGFFKDFSRDNGASKTTYFGLANVGLTTLDSRCFILTKYSQLQKTLVTKFLDRESQTVLETFSVNAEQAKFQTLSKML